MTLMTTQPQVAISQMSIAPGGRLRVILGLVEILNEVGITPRLLTSRPRVTATQLAQKYGRSHQIEFRLLPSVARLPSEFMRVLFNAMLNVCASDYDLLINSSNSLIFLPGRKKVISYVHFPRKRRIVDASLTLHRPEVVVPRWSKWGLERVTLRFIYRFSKPQPHHLIVCNSEFTRAALRQVYDLPANLPVVYPPVDTVRFRREAGPRASAVVSVGRFTPSKRQLEQIQLAGKLPHLSFHIIGFANNNAYYQQCHRYVESHQLHNVHLHPDAPFDEMLSHLQSARYFLHTLVNEPFGITAVQAIAAGCLPIVHDSGGQRETVIVPELRYQDLEEVPEIIERLEALDEADVESLTSHLQQHAASRFDAQVFHRQMRDILRPYLGVV